MKAFESKATIKTCFAEKDFADRRPGETLFPQLDEGVVFVHCPRFGIAIPLVLT